MDFRVRIDDDWWRVVDRGEILYRGDKCLGLCTPDHEIHVLRKVKGRKLVDVLIHEALHASIWPLRENYIDHAAEFCSFLVYSEQRGLAGRDLTRFHIQRILSFDAYGLDADYVTQTAADVTRLLHHPQAKERIYG